MLNILRLKDIFRDKNGKTLPYVKDITRSGAVVIVKLHGFIDSNTIPTIEADISDKRYNYLDSNILLDFGEVTHVDSTTLAYLISLLHSLKAHHRRLGIINAGAALLNYINIEKVGELVHIYKTEEEALKDLA